MSRESSEDRARRAKRIVKALFAAHPDAHCALDHHDAFELLCATILSAQCTDKKVNEVTPELFRRYPTAKKMAVAEPTAIESLIRPTGFYRSKAKSLLAMARAVADRYGGSVPHTMEELVELPGVGRKTANVILGNAFEIPGIVVDTHVGRIAQRLELTREKDPVRIEQDLMALVPRKHWTQFSHAMIFHGRRICAARTPKCDVCPLIDDCPYPRSAAGKAAKAGPKKTAAKRGGRTRARGKA
jgi:endonuclease-3